VFERGPSSDLSALEQAQQMSRARNDFEAVLARYRAELSEISKELGLRGPPD
jgi:hypothetical protein